MYTMMTRAAIYTSTATPAAPMVKRIKNQAYGDLKMGQVATPVGPLSLGTTKDGLKAAYFDTLWEDQPESLDTGGEASDAMMREAKVQVEEYFAGIRKEFSIPLAGDGTSFQKRAWAALEKIPYGETICYEEQAISMGEPTKARAVGAANGKNPICLFVPCHRVIAKDGGLCGFGGGVKIKQYLIDLEAGRLNDSHHQAKSEL